MAGRDVEWRQTISSSPYSCRTGDETRDELAPRKRAGSAPPRPKEKAISATNCSNECPALASQAFPAPRIRSAIASSRRATPAPSRPRADANGAVPFVCCKAAWCDERRVDEPGVAAAAAAEQSPSHFLLATWHGRNTHRVVDPAQVAVVQELCAHLRRWCDKAVALCCVLAGDFNIVLQPGHDRQSRLQPRYDPAEFAGFERLDPDGAVLWDGCRTVPLLCTISGKIILVIGIATGGGSVDASRARSLRGLLPFGFRAGLPCTARVAAHGCDVSDALVEFIRSAHRAPRSCAMQVRQ